MRPRVLLDKDQLRDCEYHPRSEWVSRVRACTRYDNGPFVKVHGAGCASRSKSANIAVSATVNRPASGAASSGKLARTGHHYCHHRRSSAAIAHWTASVSSCRCADVGGRAAPGAGQFAHLARAPDAGPANKGPNVRDYSSSGRRAGFQVSQCIKGVVPLEGLEPTTPSLRMMCSTS